MENKQNKKILIATGIYPPNIGGPATYSKLLFDELPKYGYLVSVYSFDDVRKYPKILRHLIYFFKLLYKSYNVDLIFAQDTVSVGLPSALVSNFLNKTFFLRVPGDYAWEQASGRFVIRDSIEDFQTKKYSFKIELLRNVQKFVANQANVVITPSNYFTNIVKNWVKNKEKVITIYNGISFENYFEEKIQYKPKTIISAGRLVPWKHFDDLVDLVSKLDGWNLTIVGDGPEKNNLENKIKNLNLLNRIELIDKLDRKSLINEIKKNEIFILNSSFESFSFQLIEAMQAGTPVICKNIGNLSEIIEDGKNGVFYNKTLNDLKLKVLNIHNDKEFRNKLIDTAKITSKKFSIERTIEELISKINTMI